MVTYLVKRYVRHTAALVGGLVVLPVLFGGAWLEVIPGALLTGGLLGAAYTEYRIRTRQIGPLFDNLRVPRYAVLGGCFGGLQVLNLALVLLA
jgi:hypothetical protein